MREVVLSGERRSLWEPRSCPHHHRVSTGAARRDGEHPAWLAAQLAVQHQQVGVSCRGQRHPGSLSHRKKSYGVGAGLEPFPAASIESHNVEYHGAVAVVSGVSMAPDTSCFSV